MNHNGPIIIIEDDEDDQEILQEIFNRLQCQNEILFFSDGFKAISYFNEHTSVTPFLIISDMNLPKVNGLELRDMLRENDNLALRNTPYIFFTTAANNRDVHEAYKGSVQGFFIKPPNMGELERMIKRIIEYWSDSKAPA